MSNQQNRFFRYLRLAFVSLAFVLYPFFINQLPELKDLIENFPTPVVIVVAFVFAIIVVQGPELLNVEETPPEELWGKLLQKNQELINDRLKQSLDQDRHIPIPSIDSPDDLERPQRKDSSATVAAIANPAPSPQKGWKKWVRKFLPDANLSKVIADKFPQLQTRRNLENLQTEEVTQLPPTKPIVEIFKEANGRLLILGEPGSGKTTELLKLAQALGEEAKNNPEKPIPFIFELSAWRGESMLEWMVGGIVAQYGLNPKLCQEWLVHNRIVPLLDGLDELGRDNNGIKEAILALNSLQEDYHKQQHSLVICCRVKDYQSITDDNNCRIRLKEFERAVRLCELADDQIEWYLHQRKAEHIWDELQSNSGLMALARNPMLLNLMPIAYPDRLPNDLPQDFQDCQSRLFDDFLHRKLYPPKSITPQPLADYDPEKARYYLAWLAASMGRPDINQREFLIENLKPSWLETEEHRNLYSVNEALIFALILGLTIWFIEDLIDVLIFVLIGGVIFGLIGGLKTDIKVRTYPNQGIWETGIKFLITIGLAMPLSGVMRIVTQWATGQEVMLSESLIFGIWIGIYCAYLLVGDAFIEHFMLRGFLCEHGRIPRDYVHFLNEASACGILKEYRGRYRFYHDKLREHLASTIQFKFDPISPRKKNKFFGGFLHRT